MKFVIRRALILFILLNNVCYAQVVLRFQPVIDNKATRLGDVLHLEKDTYHWSNLPLESHPTPGEIITKDKMMAWMTQRLGLFHSTWEGKTTIVVKQSTQSSGKALVTKAKAALMEQLNCSLHENPSKRNKYTHVEATPLSHLKDSEYALNDWKAEINLTHPTPKRVCVWLTHGKSRIAVWFNVHAYANVLVANRDIRYDTPIQRDAFSLKERNIAGLIALPAQIIPFHAWLKSSIKRNVILLESQLKEPPLIVHGQHVNVATHNHHITIVVDAIALADGYLGETITVKNPLNKKTFVARISGFQQAEITS